MGYMKRREYVWFYAFSAFLYPVLQFIFPFVVVDLFVMTGEWTVEFKQD